MFRRTLERLGDVFREPHQTSKVKNPELVRYSHALSREMQEGGFTFLHRVFCKNITTGQPIVISSGENYFEYSFKPGHTVFSEGIRLLKGNSTGEEWGAFMDIVAKFNLTQAKKESGLFMGDAQEVPENT